MTEQNTRGGSHDQHVKAGEQSHKNDAARGGSHDQDLKSGAQHDKNQGSHQQPGRPGEQGRGDTRKP